MSSARTIIQSDHFLIFSRVVPVWHCVSRCIQRRTERGERCQETKEWPGLEDQEDHVISEELISCDKVTMNSTGDIEEAVLERWQNTKWLDRKPINIHKLRCPSAENEPDYWVLPIFVFFIISGVFGNILVCLAISTNR